MDDIDFDRFYRQTRDDCYRALLVAVGDPSEAEDLLGDAYVRAFARWTTVSAHPQPRAWVMRTALNLQRDRWRRLRRLARMPSWQRSSPPPDPPVEPRLLAALTALPDQQRRVVALRVVFDLDTAQTATVLGVSPGTVTTHLFRGLAALRASLTPEEVL
jgi:RNA polymerase sigma-70 factor (ECF subfamily)